MEHRLATMLSKMSGARLVCILHDLWPSDTRQLAATLRQAHVIHAVSEPLVHLCQSLVPCAVSLLPPVGVKRLSPPTFSSQANAIGMTGSLSPHWFVEAAKLELPLLALGPVQESPVEVEFHSHFPKMTLALNFFQERCRALLVMQPTEAVPYSRYSFPGKLVDFCQTGLPIIIVAEPSSVLGRWAEKHRWQWWIKTPCASVDIARIKCELNDQAAWERESFRVRELADTEFNTEAINRRFIDSTN
jgi:hypothetical protein